MKKREAIQLLENVEVWLDEARNPHTTKVRKVALLLDAYAVAYQVQEAPRKKVGEDAGAKAHQLLMAAYNEVERMCGLRSNPNRVDVHKSKKDPKTTKRATSVRALVAKALK